MNSRLFTLIYLCLGLAICAIHSRIGLAQMAKPEHRWEGEEDDENV